MPDYLPSNDDELDAFALNFINWLNFNFGSVGLTGLDIAPLQASQPAFAAALAAFKALRVAYRAGVETKDTAKGVVVPDIRVLAQRIQTFPGTTNAIRVILGLTVPDETPGGGAPPPGSIPRPIPVVKSTNKLEQIVRWTNEATGRTPNPKGIWGVQIFLKIGDPPAGIEQMALAASDESSPHLREFDAADAGKTAHWVLRYVEKADGSGEIGPQSEVESATILG